MDDFVIFAATRWRLRAAIGQMHAVLGELKLAIHPHQRFIGKTEKGFDFLGYRLRPCRKWQPAQQSLKRLIERARRLHERGADERRLRQYVRRWFVWLPSTIGCCRSNSGPTKVSSDLRALAGDYVCVALSGLLVPGVAGFIGNEQHAGNEDNNGCNNDPEH